MVLLWLDDIHSLMNFLAHIYLSGKDLPLLIGNFIGDFVKGKEYDAFPPEIQRGIRLHRKIDHFTDTHEIVTVSKDRLRSKYRHYAGVITDIYYDHFLAKNWSRFHPEALEPYTLAFYQIMDEQRDNLLDRVNYVLYHMKRDNWLYQYRTMEGIGKALHGISRRTKFDSKMDESIHDLEADYRLYEQEFLDFFPALESHCQEFINSNNGQ